MHIATTFDLGEPFYKLTAGIDAGRVCFGFKLPDVGSVLTKLMIYTDYATLISYVGCMVTSVAYQC